MIQRIFPRDFQIVVTYLLLKVAALINWRELILILGGSVKLDAMYPKICMTDGRFWKCDDRMYLYIHSPDGTSTCSMIMVRPDCGSMNNFLGPLMWKCHSSFRRQPNLILMELMGWLLKCSSWLTALKLNYETNWPVIPYHWTGPLDGSPVANNLRCRTSSSTNGHFTVAHEKWLHR